jgi:hypothetical protein
MAWTMLFIMIASMAWTLRCVCDLDCLCLLANDRFRDWYDITWHDISKICAEVDQQGAEVDQLGG